ncbi:MAG TPA: signal peptidase II [Caulobacteraceae bacterium]|nr:signal peptidase II [Caulobacteraceae bacterium]
MKRPALVAYGLAVAIIVADQLVKLWVLQGLGLGDGHVEPVVWPLQLNLVWNRGVSFGLFGGEAELTRWLLTAFAAIVSVILAVWVRRMDRPLTGVGIGLVMGGALGNMIDRIRFGAVVDFVDVTRLHVFPWVFNVADSAITVGVIVLLAEGLLTPEKRAT